MQAFWLQLPAHPPACAYFQVQQEEHRFDLPVDLADAVEVHAGDAGSEMPVPDTAADAVQADGWEAQTDLTDTVVGAHAEAGLEAEVEELHLCHTVREGHTAKKVLMPDEDMVLKGQRRMTDVPFERLLIAST